MTELTKEEERLAKLFKKFLNLSDDDRDKIIRIIKTYPKKKIIVALRSAYTIDKRGKQKPIKRLDEFEKILKRIRY